MLRKKKQILIILILFCLPLCSGQASCPAGRHGPNCEHACSQHCVNSLHCQRETGVCTNGCKPDWQPPYCVCPAGRHGPGCGNTCNQHCAPHEQCVLCPGVCKDAGFKPPYCNTTIARFAGPLIMKETYHNKVVVEIPEIKSDNTNIVYNSIYLQFSRRRAEPNDRKIWTSGWTAHFYLQQNKSQDFRSLQPSTRYDLKAVYRERDGFSYDPDLPEQVLSIKTLCKPEDCLGADCDACYPCTSHDHCERCLRYCEQHPGCPAGKYGPQCRQDCSTHRCKNNEVCNPNNGHCDSGCQIGYQPPMCDTNCKFGTYGENCSTGCSPNCAGNSTSCHHVTGACSAGCVTAEWEPPLCNTRKTCPHGFYGNGCLQRCGHCQDNQTCDVISGICPARCEPGWMTPLCQQRCSQGKYGQDCGQSCSENCQGDTCDVTSGHCQQGCKPGWKSELCDKSCDPNTYGENCQNMCHENCQGGCDPKTGTCVACKDDFRAPGCTQERARLQSSLIQEMIEAYKIQVKMSEFSAAEIKSVVLQIREPSEVESQWGNSSEVTVAQIGEAPLEYSDLNPDTWYELRAVLVESDGGSYQGPDIPILLVRTSCKPADSSETPIHVYIYIFLVVIIIILVTIIIIMKYKHKSRRLIQENENRDPQVLNSLTQPEYTEILETRKNDIPVANVVLPLVYDYVTNNEIQRELPQPVKQELQQLDAPQYDDVGFSNKKQEQPQCGNVNNEDNLNEEAGYLIPLHSLGKTCNK